jgi:hypothetical protein
MLSLTLKGDRGINAEKLWALYERALICSSLFKHEWNFGKLILSGDILKDFDIIRYMDMTNTEIQ